MNYIGSKIRLLPFIDETIRNVVEQDLYDKVFCDLFAGTGAVGRFYKNKVKTVISNDLEYYSYVILRHYIGNNKTIEGVQEAIDTLNNLPLIDNGFIYNNYCLGGRSGRQYFSDYNGQKIDTIRTGIEKYKDNPDLYYLLLCSLIECADKLANVASVYGAFLKHLKKSAQPNLILKPMDYTLTDNVHQVCQEDANKLITKISGDILYLDPPYNERQYGAYYHILNTIAEYKPFVPKGKTGQREYNRSKYCVERVIRHEFEELIKNANFKYIFMSYNNEGLMSPDDIQTIMGKYGEYRCATKEYQRFKADRNENRVHKAATTTEYLHILIKN